MNKKLAIRWTIGEVSKEGFEALRFSIFGLWNIFKDKAEYTVCVNTISLEQAQESTGEIMPELNWHQAYDEEIPFFIREHLDENKAEGVGWKFAPLLTSRKLPELSLDNDCIIWELPPVMDKWIAESNKNNKCLFAEDVAVSFGKFSNVCRPNPRNSGIRGIPPGFDLEEKLKLILEKNPVKMNSELDEQGFQYAAVSAEKEPYIVSVDDVSVCSPFPPHLPSPGRYGVHCVGLNAKLLPWEFKGKRGDHYIREKWKEMKKEIAGRIKIYDTCVKSA